MYNYYVFLGSRTRTERAFPVTQALEVKLGDKQVSAPALFVSERVSIRSWDELLEEVDKAILLEKKRAQLNLLRDVSD